MENLFDNLFPITDKKYPENNKILKLEMEIEQLKLCLKMAQSSNMQRKEAMDIMKRRLEEQKKLLDRFNAIMQEQNSTILQQQEIIDHQKEQLEHIERINNRMEVIRSDQSEILRYAGFRN